MFYIIYKTTNLANGKFYVGKHKTKYLDDGYMGSGKILKHAISKYGLDNFHREILYICRNEKHMNLLEKILVVPDPELNYNLCPGGHGGFGYINSSLSEDMKEVRKSNLKHTPDVIHRATRHASSTLKKTHAAGKIRYNTFTGKTRTAEWKRDHSLRMKEKTGSKNSQFGTMWITNGVENKKIKKEVDIIPEGWYKGRILPTQSCRSARLAR